MGNRYHFLASFMLINWNVGCKSRTAWITPSTKLL